MLDQCGSQKVGLILAHQRLHHFDGNKATLDAMLNVPIKMANVRNDAYSLNAFFGFEEHEHLHIPRGKWATYLDHPDHTERIVLSVRKSELEFMTDAEQSAIRHQMRDRYGAKGTSRPNLRVVESAPFPADDDLTEV
jgi:hypothetical protein